VNEEFMLGLAEVVCCWTTLPAVEMPIAALLLLGLIWLI
jgi:hypothetical protein